MAPLLSEMPSFRLFTEVRVGVGVVDHRAAVADDDRVEALHQVRGIFWMAHGQVEGVAEL